MGRWSDQRLVAECIAGSEPAWAALIERYKGLVYSICLNYSKSEADASDIFQDVWFQAHLKLSTVREIGSLRAWLITVTRNSCFRWQAQKRSLERRETGGYEAAELDRRGSVPPPDFGTLETHLRVHEAIDKLTPRCQHLIRMLFFRQPPLPYRDIASRLRMAVGSVPFIRARCLEKLHRLLQEESRPPGASS